MNYLSDPKYVEARRRAIADEIRESRMHERWSWVARLASLVQAQTGARQGSQVVSLAQRRAAFDRALDRYLDERHAA